MSPCGRRTFLAAALRAGAGAGATLLLPAALAGCGHPGTKAAVDPVTLPLAMLPEGERTRVMVGDDPVELLRRGGEVVARSLMCTHQGCEVAWHDDQDHYVCPCHGGRFDAAGDPVYGPPRAPLRTVPVRVTGAEVVVGA